MTEVTEIIKNNLKKQKDIKLVVKKLHMNHIEHSFEQDKSQ